MLNPGHLLDSLSSPLAEVRLLHRPSTIPSGHHRETRTELQCVVIGVGVLAILKTGVGGSLIAASYAEARTINVRGAPDTNLRTSLHSSPFALGVVETISDKIAPKR